MEIDLPIFQCKEAFVQLLNLENNCILKAPTASGKSTLIPQFLLDEVIPKGKTVLVLQPRRIAARMLAKFVSESRGVALGKEVGYQVRLEGAFGPETKILFVTEGILLHRLLQNDLLAEVGAVVFDEFHERHLETDLGLALVRDLQINKRPDLKIVVMSATLDIKDVQLFLGDCKVVETFGRLYPVSIRYHSPKPYEFMWDVAAFHAELVMKEQNEGSLLIFMPGNYEIQKTIDALLKRESLSSYEILPLHGSLSRQDQDKAVRAGGRKIIVTTNVAETSLTIPGVRIVIDSGLAKVAKYDSRRSINTLFTESIGKSSADQRAGRAGRVGPGICIRLWSEFEHQHRAENHLPEIHRIDLSESVLRIIASGRTSIDQFNWLEKPSGQAIKSALEMLTTLGALDEQFHITNTGVVMSGIHVHPRLGRMLVEAKKLNCLPAACLMAALAQSTGILQPTSDEIKVNDRFRDIDNPGSDLLFELNAWFWADKVRFDVADCRKKGIDVFTGKQIAPIARLIFQQISPIKSLDFAENYPKGIAETENLRKCILAGFVDFLAIRHRPSSPLCQLLNGRSGMLHRDSVVQESKFMVATEMEEVKSPTGIQLQLKKVTAIEESWIVDLHPQGINIMEEIVYDKELKRVVKINETKLYDLVLDRTTIQDVDPEDASRLLTQLILDQQIAFPSWNEEVDQLVRRINFASTHAPQYGIPRIDEDAREFIIQQSIYQCKSEKELNKCNVKGALKDWLTYEQHCAVDLVAPVSIQLPRRKRPVPLHYDDKGDVILSETIQGLYDCPLPVTVAEGRVGVVFEILAPSRRQVQITRDLDYFWKNSYHQIKKELKGRYPKHEWR